ncbi:MAG: ribonuclease HI family protein [Bacteroidota bacterium]
MILHAYIDGASRGNPGASGIALLLQDNYGRLLFAACEYIGEGTNNAAEYTALERCLEVIPQIIPARSSRSAEGEQIESLVVHSDSELLVRQVNKEYAVREPALKRRREGILKLMGQLPFPVRIEYIPREENRQADALANRAIDYKLSLPIRRTRSSKWG